MRTWLNKNATFIFTASILIFSSNTFATGYPTSYINQIAFTSPFGGPGGISTCDTFCRIKQECTAKTESSTLAEYQQWLADMSQGFYNYQLICANIQHPDAGGWA